MSILLNIKQMLFLRPAVKYSCAFNDNHNAILNKKQSKEKAKKENKNHHQQQQQKRKKNKQNKNKKQKEKNSVLF
jgi:hypothetical protein